MSALRTPRPRAGRGWRRIATAAGLALSLAVASCATGGPALDPAGQQAVSRVQDWFDGLHGFRSRFVQTDANGEATGTVSYAAPGRLRLDYDPSDRLLVVASGGHVVAVQRDTGAVTAMPVRATPLGILLGPTLRLDGPKIDVVAVDTPAGALQVSLAQAGDRARGLLTLFFKDGSGPAGLTLAGIETVDAERRRTRFRFFDATTGVAFAADTFVLPS